MLISLVQLCGGFILLVWGADRLVAGSSATARNLGVSPLIIGLTVIAFGTSAPEMVVSSVAAWQGKPGLAVGNAIGSNSANIGLILGITALIYPLRVESATLKREYPQLMLIMIVSLLMAVDLHFSRLEGWILLIGLALLIAGLVRLGLRKAPADPLAREFAAEIPTAMPMKTALLWILVGLLVLPLSSHFLVQGALTIPGDPVVCCCYCTSSTRSWSGTRQCPPSRQLATDPAVPTRSSYSGLLTGRMRAWINTPL